MAEDFQAGICRDNWWNFSPRGVLGSGGPACSPAVFDMMGSYGWPADVVDMKPRSTNCIETSLVCHSPISHQDAQKPQQHTEFMDSTLHMMGFGLSPSSALDWNQSFLCNNGNMLQEDMTSKLTDIDSSQIQKDFSSGSEDSAINAFKPQSTDDFIVSSSVTCTATCQGLPPNFPVVSSSPSNVYQSTLLNSLINPEPEPQQSLYNNGLITPNYEMNSNGFSPSWVKTSLPKLQPPELLYNNTHFSNASTTSVNNLLPDLLPSAQANFLRSNFEEKSKRNSDHVRDVKKMGSNPNPPLKRPRIGAPSPLPTFKVRKEKLGDRITVLQQLVSPFGKTDTASVLQEAIEYIKFLHDQVNNLSTPYMKNGAPSIHQQQGCEQTKGTEEPKQDLESRGLCLVPLSSTFPIASETTADFWTPTFRGPFR